MGGGYELIGYIQAAADVKSSIAPWISAGGAIVVALLAGTFALLQSRRTSHAQRELEREKLRAAERAAELAQERAEHAGAAAERGPISASKCFHFSEAQAAIDASYLAAYIPEHFTELARHFPQVLSHADSGLHKWSQAII